MDKKKESKKYGWYPKGLIASPLKGPAGNQEYLLWMSDEVGEDIEIERFDEKKIIFEYEGNKYQIHKAPWMKNDKAFIIIKK